MLNNKLLPKCLYQDAGFGYSAKGYILPCCWAEDVVTNEFKIFYQEKFKLSNVEDVEKEILNSKEWSDFYKILIETPEKAPGLCYKQCSIDSKHDKYEIMKEEIDDLGYEYD